MDHSSLPQAVESGRRDVAEQNGRIHRQRALIAELARKGRADDTERAQDELRAMLDDLDRIEARLDATTAPLSPELPEPVDETIMDKVAQECPL